jgi:hypothetical protein
VRGLVPGPVPGPERVLAPESDRLPSPWLGEFERTPGRQWKRLRRGAGGRRSAPGPAPGSACSAPAGRPSGGKPPPRRLRAAQRLRRAHETGAPPNDPYSHPVDPKPSDVLGRGRMGTPLPKPHKRYILPSGSRLYQTFALKQFALPRRAKKRRASLGLGISSTPRDRGDNSPERANRLRVQQLPRSEATASPRAGGCPLFGQSFVATPPRLLTSEAARSGKIGRGRGAGTRSTSQMPHWTHRQTGGDGEEGA